MSEMPYVTRADGKNLRIAPFYQQVFHHESSQPKTMPEYTLIKGFVQLPEQNRQVTLEVLKMLSQFVFATRDQMVRLLDIKGIDSSTLDGDLSQMLENRQVNCFYLAETASPEFEPAEDAFLIYCMDFGALCLLNHFSSSDSLSWFTTDANRSSELVLKYLATVEFFLSLAKVQGPSLRYFKPAFDVAFGHREIRFSGAFEIEDANGQNHSFLLETIRNFDLPVIWRDKLDKKVVHFVSKPKSWGKYFLDEPVVLLLVENDRDALEAAELFYRRTEKTNFRLITDDQVRAGLENARFLKYVPYQAAPVGQGYDEETARHMTELDEATHTGSLVAVRASLLSGT